MGRLTRPLNKEAIKKADIEFYQGHPELLKNGKPSPLSVNDPDQAQLCNEWQQLYQKHGGEIETEQEQFAAKKPDDPVQPCPLQPKNWIDLEYLYADGQGISGARYQVFDSTTDALLTAGVLNGKGKAHADLPLEVNQVKVRYFNDPTEVETIHESQPQAFLEPSGWYERMTDNIKSSGSWTWGVIQGDFNENPTMAQIATNAVITAIPVVDQVADVRDIVAIVKQMVWEKRNDIATWFALFITVIGLIPTVGSLLKGVLKAIWHGAKLGEILKIFNYFKKSNGVKWLKELRAGKLKRYAQQAADNAHKLFDALSEKLTQLKAHVPKAMSDTHKALDDTLTRLGEIKGQINSKFAEIAESLKQKLGRSLDEAGDELSLSNTQTKNTRKQELEEPVSERYNDGGVKNRDVFHAVTHPDAATGVLKGVDPKFLNPKSRFGAAFYVAEKPGTTLAELSHHGATPTHGIRFDYNASSAKVLDLTDTDIAKAWKYKGGNISSETQKIGAQAKEKGFNVIRFGSQRDPGGINNAILDNFDELLVPKFISPAKP